MANTTTLADLRKRVLDYADDPSSSFGDADRVRDYINAGLGELHDMLVDSYQDYLLKENDITLVSGTEDYALPTDFFKLVKLFYVSGNRRYKLHQFNLDELDGYRDSPIASGTVEMWYIPQLTNLVEEDDTIDISVPVSWEDFVALSAAVRLLMREESSEAAAAFSAERDRQRTRIIGGAAPRDAGTPYAIADYYGRFNSLREMTRFEERYLRYRVMGNNLKVIETEYLGL